MWMDKALHEDHKILMTELMDEKVETTMPINSGLWTLERKMKEAGWSMMQDQIFSCV